MSTRLPAPERRRQLLDVALTVFAARGYHATSMNDVAEAAGVTKPVLYQHFRSKRALYLELLEDVGGRLREAIDKATATASGPRDQVQSGFLAYFTFVASQQPAFQLLFGGGARRDEEASRAKERIYSFRSPDHKWDPRNQRPELWNVYNGMIKKGESVRAFPLSNWTEVDIWRYIQAEDIPLVPLYYAAERPYVERDGMMILAEDPRLELKPGETVQHGSIRFRTLGCFPLTGAIRSTASNLEEVIAELEIATVSERQGRAIDRDQSGSMEKKKREGYF